MFVCGLDDLELDSNDLSVVVIIIIIVLTSMGVRGG